MNPSDPSARTRRRRLLGHFALCIYAAWLVAGVFPISPAEGDEQGVINGATAMARGEKAYLRLAYSPEIQPGAYVLLSTASRWSGLPVQDLFAAGTVAGAALFALLAAWLLARVLAIPISVALTALLLCQEISASAYYMNTTALGMWLVFAALCLACRTPDRHTCAAMVVAIAVAGWIRIDCLLATPALPVLLYLAGRDLRTTLKVGGVIACGSLALVALLYRASGVTPASIMSIYSGRGAVEGWWPTVRALPLLLSPLICVLLAAGSILLIVRREWRLLILIAAGVGATLPVYGTSLASTKYFYHLVPFFLLAALYAGKVVWRRVTAAPVWTDRKLRVAFASAVGLLALADQAAGLLTSAPEFRRYTPSPALASLATLPGPRRPARLVIGPGEIIPTTDGFRLRTGALFAPWIWRREKTAMLAQLRQFTSLLCASPRTTVYFSGWLPYQMVIRMLRAEGFAFKTGKLAPTTMPYVGDWNDGRHCVHIDYLAYRTSPFFHPDYRPENLTGEHTYFVGDLSGLQPITELADQRDWVPLWPEHLYRFVTFFGRAGPVPASVPSG
ncbi:MAG: hypothetical protein WC485_09770 [Opitutaceae bacterium]